MYKIQARSCDENVYNRWRIYDKVILERRTNMELDNRSNKILESLIRNPNLTSKELEMKYSLTRRQLGYSLDKINVWLKDENLPEIIRTRQGRFLIDAKILVSLNDENKALQLSWTIPSKQQRVYLIILMLLSRADELSLFHFTSELEVSENTILSDLKSVRNYLAKGKLKVNYSRKHGYVIDGDEFQIRKMLITTISQVLTMNNGDKRIQLLAEIDEDLIDKFYKRIEKVEAKLNLKFTDKKMKSMPYVLILILRRIEKDKKINQFHINYEELADTKEYRATEEILFDFKTIPLEDRLFITLHILTTNVYSSSGSVEEIEASIPNLTQALEEMLFLFEKKACIYLQDKDKLLNKLVLHVKPAYYRIKFNLTEINESKGKIDREFRELHHLVKESTKPLSDLIGLPFPNNEAMYLTLLIGGWLTRQGDSIEEKIKAIVVCPEGISISRIMLSTLKELFPEFIFLDALSVREFYGYKLNFDIVFSPVMLNTDKKLFIVNQYLAVEDRIQLRKRVQEEVFGYSSSIISLEYILNIVEKHTDILNEQGLRKDLTVLFENDISNKQEKIQEVEKISLNELINFETIILKESVATWQEAIYIAAEPLLNNNSITENYVDTIIANYNYNNPYIFLGSKTAIPHAAPEDGVNKVAMSLLRLENGVNFSEDHKINVVVLIAAVDREKHLKALLQLTKLVQSEHDIDLLVKAKTKAEIDRIINKYSMLNAY